MKLDEFLVKVKKNTYASNGEGGEKKLENGGKELTYTEGEYKYVDTKREHTISALRKTDLLKQNLKKHMHLTSVD